MSVAKVEMARNGPEFSRIVHGLWRLAEWRKSRAETVRIIQTCMDAGITTFDHADIYGDYTCEELFGAALAETSIPRDRIQLVTKCGIKLVSENRPAHRIKCYDTSRCHILDSVDNSLRNLRTDYIDLLLIHRPDPLMNADEVARAFSQLKESGKVLHFGVSNFLPFQFKLLASKTDLPLVTNQVEFSVMNMDAQHDGTLDMCQELSIRPMAWSPLAGGRLFTEDSEQAVRLRRVLEEIGADFAGASLDQVALAWILNHPANFVVVLGTGNADRIKSAVEAEAIRLSREQWFLIWSASTGRDVP